MAIAPKTFNKDRVFMVYLNEQIKAPNIIILDEAGTNLWTFPRKKALEMAGEQGMDLVQMRYDAETMTSTVKMVDYGKYMYQKWKDDKEKRKTQRPTVLKELKINYAIGENDLQMKIKKAIEFLKERYNVKFFIKLKGREKIYANKAIEKLVRIKGDLSEYGKSQFETPKQEAQGYSIILFSK
ncbi:MAG: translation initiation factor IF-3 [uncultured bacterium (gcode 4)]|uniref:Translation initiation factor IF-3 n=1 Tax=uncultured bacterium (gcode 4) TaxID=1234023 RepID=K1XHZ2_9BACT|nr:MAG: translation initiation factor IF-3 [uncultured bacterium (gcode 4)]